MTSVPQTTNYKFWLPPFNLRVWHDYVNQNMQIMDAVLARFVLVNNMKGVWQNSTAFVAGDRVVDPDTGTIYTCNVPHTSAATPTTFEEDRIANPTFWTVFTFSVQFRGDWASGEDYAVGDFVVSSRKLAIATTSHTAGSTFTNDQQAGKWNVLIDGDVLAALPTLVAANEGSVLRVSPLAQYELATGISIDDLGNVSAPSFGSVLFSVDAGGEITFGNALAASQTRTNLGVAIGSDVQAHDASLDAYAALVTAANKGLYFTGADAPATFDLTAFARNLLDDADAETARATLGANGNLKTVQIFGASGTYTPPAGLKLIKVTCVGGGGGGGGVDATAAGQAAGASGGGGGGTVIKYIDASALGATEAVTVGAGGQGGTAGAFNGTTGGSSIFGAHCSATGGTGGSGSTANNVTRPWTNGGTGGGGASGNVNITGEAGGYGFIAGAAGVGSGGNGGSSTLGGGGLGPVTGATANGNGGGAYGGGGGGAANGPSQTAKAGGNGGQGIVIVEEYY